jgi:hypothetical protein
MFIGKARNCVADLYGLRDIQFDIERLCTVQHLLEEDRFLWHEAERDMLYEVTSAVGSPTWPVAESIEIQDITRPFLAKEIPEFIHLLFFRRIRKKGPYAQGNFHWIRKNVSPTLIVLAATALQWALLEYTRTDGRIPHKRMTVSPQIPFSRENVAGMLAFQCTGLF